MSLRKNTKRKAAAIAAMTITSVTSVIITATPGVVMAQATVARQEQAQRHSYHIPAGALAPALRNLASVAEVPLTFTADQTEGKTTTGINGQYTAQEAFTLLLQGTGLLAVRLENGGYVLRPLTTAATTAAGDNKPASSASTLPDVQVTASADKEKAWGQVYGYVAKRSATGTKTDTALIETPQSISVITSDQIQAQASKNIRDVIGYTPGVGAQTNGYRDTDNLMLRGFQVDNSSIRRDGLRSPSNTFTGTQEPYGLERVEILRGAASLLYGATEPGGLINLVTKRPSAESWHEAGLEVGSYNRVEATADLTGSLNQEGSLSYRLTMLNRKSDSFIDFVPSDRLYIAPALNWKIADSTQLTLLTHYQESKLNRQWGLPPEGSLLPNKNGVLPRGLSIGEPIDHRKDIHKSAALLLEHQQDGQNKINFSIRRNQVDLDWNYAGRDSLRDDQRTLTRYFARRMEKVAAWTFDTNLQSQIKTGFLDHQLTLGVDGSSADAQRTRRYSLIAPLDLFKPVYGAKPYGDDGKDGYRENTRSLGIYLQDQIKIDNRWVLLLGARHDNVKIAQSDYFEPAWNTDKTTSTIGRAGLVYLADNGFAPFLSFSQSFQPIGGNDRLGARFKPSKGEQYEFGLRYQPGGSNTLLSAAVYQLTQSNVQVPDPLAPDDYSIQTGEIRARGLELEAKTDLTRNLRLITAYTYTDAKTTKAGPTQPNVVGQRQANTPANQFSAWADYQFAEAGIPKLRLGMGVRYVGQTLAANAPYQVPAFHVFDTGLSYDMDKWRFKLNVKNLTDKSYIVECGDGYCNYGDPRQVTVSAQYRW
ncbi:TonB-dependent siderophore receptor [Undibacterium sp. Di27W]|uniref:TonB-dependent siderophore receptor n=1 Tax=Undibacterium sp. Di27W TaxID=3413036 RepID=UPI003BF3EFE1